MKAPKGSPRAADSSRIVSGFHATSAAGRVLLAVAVLSVLASAPAGAQHTATPAAGHAVTAAPPKPAAAPDKPTAAPAKPIVVRAASRRGRPSPKSAAHAVEKIVVALGARHEHASPLHNLPAGSKPAPPQRRAVNRPPAVPRPLVMAPQLPRRPVAWPARDVAVQWPAPPTRVEMEWPADQVSRATLRWQATTILSDPPAEPASLDH